MQDRASLCLSSKSRGTALIFSLVLLAIAVACGGGNKGGTDPKTVSISISPATASIFTAQTQTFTASVTNATNTAVTWSVQEGNTGGSITSSGVYTAPTTAGTYHVVATSQADTTKSATATVTVTAVAVSVTPATATLAVGDSRNFTATVTPAEFSNKAVTWSVQEPDGGTISADGRYTAPTTLGTYHVKATSVADTSKSGTATVTVVKAAADFAVNQTSGPANEGDPYRCTFAMVNPADTLLTFTLGEGSPNGASIEANNLSWTPSADQSRKANTFTVTGTDSEGGIRTKSWTVSPSGTIHGTMMRNYTSGTQVPVDLQLASITVDYVNETGALVNAAGTGHSDGSFEIYRVPAGEYRLTVDGAGKYMPIMTSASSVNLNYTVLGHPVTYATSGGTARKFSITGMDPWDNSNMQLQWYVPNTGEYQNSSGATIPQGSTSLELTFPVWALAAAGDVGFAKQFEHGEKNGIQYGYVAKSAGPLNVVDTDGSTTTVNAGLTGPVPFTFRAKINLSKFIGPNSPRPSSIDGGIDFGIFSYPTSPKDKFDDETGEELALVALWDLTGVGETNGSSPIPHHTAAAESSVADLDLGDFTVGNPYPSSWTPIYELDQNLLFTYSAPGSAVTFLLPVEDYQMTDVTPTADQPVTPLISPITAGTVDGKDLFASQTGISLSPTITWQDNQAGTDTGYELIILAADAPEQLPGMPTQNPATPIRVYGAATAATSFKVPAGLLAPGKSYVVLISKRKESGRNLTETPFAAGMPRAQSSSLSAVFTTTTEDPGVSNTPVQTFRKLSTRTGGNIGHAFRSKAVTVHQ